MCSTSQSAKMEVVWVAQGSMSHSERFFSGDRDRSELVGEHLPVCLPEYLHRSDQYRLSRILAASASGPETLSDRTFANSHRARHHRINSDFNARALTRGARC